MIEEKETTLIQLNTKKGTLLTSSTVDVYEIFLPLHASNQTVHHKKAIWLLAKDECLIFYSNNINSLEESGYKFKSIMLFS